MNRFDPTFGVAALGALESALNAALALDPQTVQRLAALRGKVIALRLHNPPITLHVAPEAKGLRLMGFFDGTPDTTLAGSAGGFLKLATGGSGFFSGDLTITGDVELGQKFQRIFAELDFDWEEHLSRLTGDVIAHEAGNLLRGAAAWSRSAADSLRGAASEYLQQEARMLPTRMDLESFARAVETLRSDADRLEARIRNLRRRVDE